MQQPKLANNLSAAYREGKPETMAEVVSEHASQQADGAGRNIPNSRRLPVAGQQSEGGSEALSSGDRFTLRESGAKCSSSNPSKAFKMLRFLLRLGPRKPRKTLTTQGKAF